MTFNGFPPQCVTFLENLAQNNSKIWFERHRQDFEQYVMTPARLFIAALGQRLKSISPAVQADPRVNKSIFKLHRDTRFSADKSPFKTHLGLIFWEGNRKRMECSCYYFHLQPPNLFLGAGLYIFPRPHLAEFRRSVVHPEYGLALKDAVAAATAHEDIRLCEPHYKRVPAGFDPRHPNAHFLLFNGLFVSVETPMPPQLPAPAVVDYCFEQFRKMQPVHAWLVAMTERI